MAKKEIKNLKKIKKGIVRTTIGFYDSPVKIVVDITYKISTSIEFLLPGIKKDIDLNYAIKDPFNGSLIAKGWSLTTEWSTTPDEYSYHRGWDVDKSHPLTRGLPELAFSPAEVESILEERGILVY